MSDIVFPPCPHEDCTSPGHHWHVDGLTISNHHAEESCADPWSCVNPEGCVSARVPAPPPEPEPESSARLVIPEITDEEAEACFREAWGPRLDATRGECRAVMEAYRARLIESLDAWKRVPVGATIPAGVRYRFERGGEVGAVEMIHDLALVTGDGGDFFVRASDWGKVILPEPEPDEGERLVDLALPGPRLLGPTSAPTRQAVTDTLEEELEL